MKPEEAAALILEEYNRAKEKYPPPFHSQHEGYAVILEEMDELWDAIKENRHEDAGLEAIQVGAMVLQFVKEFSWERSKSRAYRG